MHLIGWQNTWEQAPGVPATPSHPNDGGTRAVYLCTRPKKPTGHARAAPVELHNRDIDHQCSNTTATLAHQLELEVVVVVGAKTSKLQIQSLSVQTHPTSKDVSDGVFSLHWLNAIPCEIVSTTGKKLSPPQDITTHPTAVGRTLSQAES